MANYVTNLIAHIISPPYFRTLIIGETDKKLNARYVVRRWKLKEYADYSSRLF